MNKYIQLDTLGFVTTWKCNSQCKHCSVAAKRANKPTVINTKLATGIIKQLKLPSSQYNPSVLTGWILSTVFHQHRGTCVLQPSKIKSSSLTGLVLSIAAQNRYLIEKIRKG
jgi:hypothetical protein